MVNDGNRRSVLMVAIWKLVRQALLNQHNTLILPDVFARRRAFTDKHFAGHYTTPKNVKFSG